MKEGFVILLQIVFITLKLVGVIEWSWLWVMAPLWINLILILLVTIIYLFITLKK